MAGSRSEPVPAEPAPDPAPALARIPCGLFIMTAAFEGTRGGIRVQFVQQVGFEPPCVCVALQKGHPMAPLIRDAHAFGLCQLSESDRFLWKKFEEPEQGIGDPFDGLEVEQFVTGSPLIARALAVLDCQVTMHLDFESDHELYVAQVVAGRVQDDARPAVRLRDDGRAY